MTPAGSDAPGLGWLLRQYAALAVLVVVAVATAGGLAAGALARSSPYEATALVIANDLQLRPEQLPRLGESVFTSGAVAREVATGLQLTRDFRTLVPEVVDLDPVPDSISFLVHGRSSDPELAARIADAGASAFVNEMNKAGAGVGRFTVQDPAYVPRDRAVRGPGPALGTAVAFVAGMALAVVVVSAVHSSRRPLFSGSAAAAAARGRLVGEVQLPRAAGAGPVRGRRPLARHLAETDRERVLLTGREQSLAARARLAEVLAEAPELAERPQVALADDVERPTARDRSVLIVVEQGTPSRDVELVRADVPDDELLGVVFTSWAGRRFLRRRPKAPAPAATTPAPQGKQRPRSGSRR